MFLLNVPDMFCRITWCCKLQSCCPGIYRWLFYIQFPQSFPSLRTLLFYLNLLCDIQKSLETVLCYVNRERFLAITFFVVKFTMKHYAYFRLLQHSTAYNVIHDVSTYTMDSMQMIPCCILPIWMQTAISNRYHLFDDIIILHELHFNNSVPEMIKNSSHAIPPQRAC